MTILKAFGRGARFDLAIAQTTARNDGGEMAAILSSSSIHRRTSVPMRYCNSRIEIDCSVWDRTVFPPVNCHIANSRSSAGDNTSPDRFAWRLSV